MDMSKDTGKPPATEPTADSPNEGPDIDRLLRLSRDATARKRARKAGRKTPHDGSRGWTREELYERGYPVAD